MCRHERQSVWTCDSQRGRGEVLTFSKHTSNRSATLFSTSPWLTLAPVHRGMSALTPQVARETRWYHHHSRSSHSQPFPALFIPSVHFICFHFTTFLHFQLLTPPPILPHSSSLSPHFILPLLNKPLCVLWYFSSSPLHLFNLEYWILLNIFINTSCSGLLNLHQV